MGWSNYLVVPQLKLVVELPREENELKGYVKEAFDNVLKIKDENECLEDLTSTTINNLDLNTLSILVNSHKLVDDLSCVELTDFLLYWLDSKGIEFAIHNEYEKELDIEELKNKGYIVLRR